MTMDLFSARVLEVGWNGGQKLELTSQYSSCAMIRECLVKGNPDRWLFALENYFFCDIVVSDVS